MVGHQTQPRLDQWEGAAHMNIISHRCHDRKSGWEMLKIFGTKLLSIETMEIVREFILLGSKINADDDCSHEIKRHLLLRRKAMINLDSILKSRDTTLPTKVHLVKVMVFPVVMYGCESWTTKKAEWWRTDAFELWCWRRLLRISWTARRSNKSILKDQSWIFIGRTDVEAETSTSTSNTLATWCTELTHLKRPWCWERLKAGGEGDDRGWDGWMYHLLDENDFK